MTAPFRVVILIYVIRRVYPSALASASVSAAAAASASASGWACGRDCGKSFKRGIFIFYYVVCMPTEMNWLDFGKNRKMENARFGPIFVENGSLMILVLLRRRWIRKHSHSINIVLFGYWGSIKSIQQVVRIPKLCLGGFKWPHPPTLSLICLSNGIAILLTADSGALKSSNCHFLQKYGQNGHFPFSDFCQNLISSSQ